MSYRASLPTFRLVYLPDRHPVDKEFYGEKIERELSVQNYLYILNLVLIIHTIIKHNDKLKHDRLKF